MTWPMTVFHRPHLPNLPQWRYGDVQHISGCWELHPHDEPGSAILSLKPSFLSVPASASPIRLTTDRTDTRVETRLVYSLYRLSHTLTLASRSHLPGSCSQPQLSMCAHVAFWCAHLNSAKSKDSKGSKTFYMFHTSLEGFLLAN